MEIAIVGRNADIPERFRTHVEEKLEKIESLAPEALRIDVELTRERNPRLADNAERIELTLRGKGPVVRAEASAADRYGALDLAVAKLQERLRRARDRRKDHRKAGPVEVVAAAVEEAPAAAPAEQAPVARGNGAPKRPGEATEIQLGDSPVVVRQKLHDATPMTIDQALYEMELVGHPFYLFVDEETLQPCVVYHRHGWTYGVIRLNTTVVTS
ncbi:MAG: ribosome-associated translation inhibitor RaiA [Actinomycetales bacterium]|nr:ribosome-associated translation inhibitor RaiA [Actinomycetales bacterium]